MDGDSIQRKLNLVFFNVITVLKHKLSNVDSFGWGSFFLPQVDNQAKGYLGGLSTKRNFKKAENLKH